MVLIKSEGMRKILRILIPCVLIPIVIILGEVVFEGKKYAALPRCLQRGEVCTRAGYMMWSYLNKSS